MSNKILSCCFVSLRLPRHWQQTLDKASWISAVCCISELPWLTMSVLQDCQHDRHVTLHRPRLHCSPLVWNQLSFSVNLTLLAISSAAQTSMRLGAAEKPRHCLRCCAVASSHRHKCQFRCCAVVQQHRTIRRKQKLKNHTFFSNWFRQTSLSRNFRWNFDFLSRPPLQLTHPRPSKPFVPCYLPYLLTAFLRLLIYQLCIVMFNEADCWISWLLGTSECVPRLSGLLNKLCVEENR